MTSEEASKLLDAMPQAGSTDATRFARIVEAWMVLDGAPHDRIKAAVGAAGGALNAEPP
jgi:hypothetical protein